MEWRRLRQEWRSARGTISRAASRSHAGQHLHARPPRRDRARHRTPSRPRGRHPGPRRARSSADGSVPGRRARHATRSQVDRVAVPGATSRRPSPIAFVGKGLCFDSAGFSIKPATGMEFMKYDMCGAAGVLGAMETIARLKLTLNVVGLIGATTNMPSGTAMNPGDVVRAPPEVDRDRQYRRRGTSASSRMCSRT